jgi:hypothetical protein
VNRRWHVSDRKKIEITIKEEDMGYNVKNWGFIASGQKIGVGYVINGGADFGAQFAQGSPENPGGNLITDSHEKILDPNGAVVYAFQLTNNGNDTFFALEGGGLS